MGLSLRITVSHVCHDLSVVISFSMLIIQIVFSLQQSLQLRYKVNALQVRFYLHFEQDILLSCDRFITTDTHCVADIRRPVSLRALLLSLMS